MSKSEKTLAVDPAKILQQKTAELNAEIKKQNEQVLAAFEKEYRELCAKHGCALSPGVSFVEGVQKPIFRLTPVILPKQLKN